MFFPLIFIGILAICNDASAFYTNFVPGKALNRLNSAQEPIDPLDFVKGSQGGDSIDDNLYPVSSNILSQKGTGRREGPQIEAKYVVELLQTVEADMLQSLPLEMLESFQGHCIAYLPRISLSAFILHVMLLIPTLRFVKLELHQSIYPYLYLSPLVVLLPFALYFLGEKCLYENHFVEERLVAYLKTQKDYATDYVDAQEDCLLDSIEEVLLEGGGGQAQKLVKNIALARLMSKIDLEFLGREVLALKRRRLGLVEEEGTMLSVTSVAGFRASNNSTRSSSVSRGLKVPRSPFFSAIESDNSQVSEDKQYSTIDAAFALIRDLRGAEAGKVRSDTEVLEALKVLQKEVEK